MKLVLCNYMHTALGIALLVSSTEGFTSPFSRRTFLSRQQVNGDTTNTNTNTVNSIIQSTTLNAKKKKKAPISTIDFDAFDDDEPLSKKEQMEAKKAAKRAAKKEAAAPKVDPKAAALAALDNLDFDDEPLSAKELAQQKKKAAKEEKKAEQAKNQVQAQAEEATGPKLDKAKAKALKALEEMERMEAQMAAEASNNDNGVDEFGMPKPKLSKKELKELKKKEEKMAAKMAAKEAKKAAKRAELGGEAADVADIDSSANGDSAGIAPGTETAPVSIPNLFDILMYMTVFEQEAIKMNVSIHFFYYVYHSKAESPKKKRITLEERIRKERPPPRVRVMESSQPNFSSLRLENIGITFRDQEVLKDVTWGVQTGDRIGLVGHNGAGKTTQLRIMYGEMEPTTGDVVKSAKDLRVSMLRQEFVDELVPERTLMEEFMSVFEEENKILTDLRENEARLEKMTGDDPDEMQRVLDDMAKLQAKAEVKDVYALESRAKKILNLMGFEDDEEDYLVAMFSGGWKMRIGLGKVLLKEPNILLLDEPTNHLDLESVSDCCGIGIPFYLILYCTASVTHVKIISSRDLYRSNGLKNSLGNKTFQWLSLVTIVNFWIEYVTKL